MIQPLKNRVELSQARAQGGAEGRGDVRAPRSKASAEPPSSVAVGREGRAAGWGTSRSRPGCAALRPGVGALAEEALPAAFCLLGRKPEARVGSFVRGSKFRSR